MNPELRAPDPDALRVESSAADLWSSWDTYGQSDEIFSCLVDTNWDSRFPTSFEVYFLCLGILQRDGSALQCAKASCRCATVLIFRNSLSVVSMQMINHGSNGVYALGTKRSSLHVGRHVIS